MEKDSDKTWATTYRGEEHGEGVDSSFQHITAPDGKDHGWQEHEVTQAEQERGQQLEAIGGRILTVGAAPAPPPCGMRVPGGKRINKTGLDLAAKSPMKGREG